MNLFSPAYANNGAVQVECGATHTAALLQNGAVYWWGDDTVSAPPTYTPTQVVKGLEGVHVNEVVRTLAL